ncbi:hypothetical protein PPERSA_11249 [Pseudocohnilembus persalinus]|uniref:Uncharacterized protein n=1 Tax=Pseudocohnilembus persalinus TaxID=266149 RepID=A0A0V0QZL1_PSEPJ|nr:hypothetical protein PPERSA_11249 [Pseudocohnilembus persalinus]|eukprot:KRX07700.1 hypothetical protein PPERSA_11249 [Pseudocohnilembus persalinus]
MQELPSNMIKPQNKPKDPQTNRSPNTNSVSEEDTTQTNTQQNLLLLQNCSTKNSQLQQQKEQNLQKTIIQPIQKVNLNSQQQQVQEKKNEGSISPQKKVQIIEQGDKQIIKPSPGAFKPVSKKEEKKEKNQQCDQTPPSLTRFDDNFLQANYSQQNLQKIFEPKNMEVESQFNFSTLNQQFQMMMQIKLLESMNQIGSSQQPHQQQLQQQLLQQQMGQQEGQQMNVQMLYNLLGQQQPLMQNIQNQQEGQNMQNNQEIYETKISQIQEKLKSDVKIQKLPEYINPDKPFIIIHKKIKKQKTRTSLASLTQINSQANLNMNNNSISLQNISQEQPNLIQNSQNNIQNTEEKQKKQLEDANQKISNQIQQNQQNNVENEVNKFINEEENENNGYQNSISNNNSNNNSLSEKLRDQQKKEREETKNILRNTGNAIKNFHKENECREIIFKLLEGNEILFEEYYNNFLPQKLEKFEDFQEIWHVEEQNDKTFKLKKAFRNICWTFMEAYFFYYFFHKSRCQKESLRALVKFRHRFMEGLVDPEFH